MAREPRTAFISYTRQGGAAAAERVRQLLAANAITPWQDRTHLRGGDDFRAKIEHAIKRCSHLVMVLTPDAFGAERQVLRWEWYTARKEGTCVVPIKGSPELDLGDDSLPRWLSSRHVVDLDQPAEVSALIAQLQSECPVERVPFMAADLPANFTPRTEPMEELLSHLLSGDTSRVAITTALRGPGGFGKTTLAQAICHDDRVIASFEHGILWVTLGEHPRILEKLTDLFKALTAEERTFVDPDTARVELADRLQWKRCLIVVDDVWNYAHLEPFLQGGRESVRLVTTRQGSIVAQAGAADVSVNEMTTAEAIGVLEAALPGERLSRSLLKAVAERLGHWPILLNLLAGHVKWSVGERQSGAGALTDLMEEFREIGPTAFDWANSESRNQAVDATVRASLRYLPPADQQRCAELSIFPEDVAVPLAVVGELWQAGEVETRRTVRRLADLGLVKFDPAARSIGMHDVIRDYLSGVLARPRAEVHAALIAAWPDPGRLPHDYAWQWYPHHLSGAGRVDELRRLLTDWTWLEARIAKHGLAALIDDYEYLDEHDPVRLVQSALMMDAQVLFRNQAPLRTQLLGRLGRGLAPEIDRLIETAPAAAAGSWLRPLRNVLHPPGGALVRVMRGYAGGHEGTVRSIAMDPQGRWAITAGNSTQDQAVIIWNLRSGSHRKLLGQAKAGGYTPLAVTSDGTLAAVASGSEVRLVETADGNSSLAPPGDGEPVTAMALSSEGAAVVWGSGDGAVWLWQQADGPPRLLGRHAGGVVAVDVDRKARIAASGTEDELTLWDLERCAALARVEVAGVVRNYFSVGFRLTDDGRVVWAGPESIERDEGGVTHYVGSVLKRWDPSDGTIHVSQLEGLSGFVGLSGDGRRALATRVREGVEGLVFCELGDSPRFVTLPRLGRGVSTGVISEGARWAATADFEHDLFVWDLDRALDPLPQPAPAPWHDLTFTGFDTSSRFAVFESADGVATVIDLETGATVQDAVAPELSLPGPMPSHSRAGAVGAGPRRAGRRKSAGNDYPVDEFAESRGHTASVTDHCSAPNGRWDLTVSHDGAARVWELAGDRPLATFVSEVGLTRCHWAPDGRTLAVIDTGRRTHLLRLEGV